MSRRRWIFLGLTLSSAVVFLIDRAFLGEPSRAEAASNESSRASRTRKNTLPKAAPAERKPGPVNLVDPSLSYLERLTEPGSTRDVFSLSSGMLGYYKALQEAPEEGTATPARPRPGTPGAFEAEHRLQGTYTGAGDALAIIDEKPMRVGDELDGFRLSRIGPYEVEFRRGPDRAVLSIPTTVAAPVHNTRKRR